MFGWLKKRLKREQAKLCYQNAASIPGLIGYFSTSNPAVVAQLKKLEDESQSICQRIWDQAPKNRSADDVNRLLEINKELRRIYDQTSLRHIKSFDEDYTPLLGWDRFYETHEL